MRENLKPLISRNVDFSGRYQKRDARGNLLLRPARVGGRKVHHAWLNAGFNEVLTAPVGSQISGQATVFEYERMDGSRDLGLTSAYGPEVQF